MAAERKIVVTGNNFICAENIFRYDLKGEQICNFAHLC